MHTTHRIRHTIGSRTCCHVIRMERTARTATRSNGEVFLAFFDAFFLIAASYWMLETSRVRGVTSDGNIYIFQMHDSNAFLYGISTIAFYVSTYTIAVFDFFNNIYFVSFEIIISYNISETIDTANDLSCVFTKTVQNNTQRVLTNFVSCLRDTDSTLSSSKGFMTSEECKALCILGKEHSTKVTMTKTYFTMVSNGTWYTESLQAFADSLSSVNSFRAALFDSDSCTKGISPSSIIKCDRLEIFNDFASFDAFFVTNLFCVLDGCNTILFADFVDFVNTALIAFE